MFNFLQKKYPNKISGKVERMGVLAASEFALYYLFKLVDCPIVFECYLHKGYKKTNEIALTKEGEEISFSYDKNNEIDSDEFKNLSYNVKELNFRPNLI